MKSAPRKAHLKKKSLKTIPVTKAELRAQLLRVNDLASDWQDRLRKHSARALFVDRQVLTLPTFTKELLDRKASVTILQDGFAYDVKVSPADLDRAFAHMEDRILIS